MLAVMGVSVLYALTKLAGFLNRARLGVRICEVLTYVNYLYILVRADYNRVTRNIL